MDSQLFSSEKNSISLLSHWFRASETVQSRLNFDWSFLDITPFNWQQAFSTCLIKEVFWRMVCLPYIPPLVYLAKLLVEKNQNLEPAPTNLMAVVQTDSLAAQESQSRASQWPTTWGIDTCSVSHKHFVRIQDSLRLNWLEMVITNQNKSTTSK